MKIYNNVLETIGSTPLVKLQKLPQENNVLAEIVVKLEYFNPGGSVKDRPAKWMLDRAEKEGLINSETTIIEPTSGNTGIGLALYCAVKGYRLILIMPDTMSIERRVLFKAYGAEIILTPGANGMKGAIAKAEELNQQISNSLIVGQFVNPQNPQSHRDSTALEIFNDTEGNLDAVVFGVGTGGTITGVGEVLKEKIPGIEVFAVEPETSAVLSGENPGKHKIQGIGAGFIPQVLNTQVYDGVIQVSHEDSLETARKLASQEGLLCGISAGANAFAAMQLGKEERFENKRILTVLCDTGERYISTGLYDD